MCKMNANEVMASFNEIMNQARKGEQTAEQVSKDLYAKAAELRAMADALTKLARQLSGNTSNEPAGREVIVIPEGMTGKELAKMQAAETQAERPKRHYNLTEEGRVRQKAANAAMWERRRMEKLHAKMAETKVS